MSFETLNYVLALGTLGLQITTGALLGMYLLQRRIPLYATYLGIIRRTVLYTGFSLSLGATIMTLYYSEILGFVPCGLCWLERVFLYPQIILFGIAMFKRDFTIATYAITLSVCGAIVALYHHFLQMGGPELMPCPASGAGDCAQRIIFEFGYITFPLMAFSLFVFAATLLWTTRRSLTA